MSPCAETEELRNAAMSVCGLTPNSQENSYHYGFCSMTGVRSGRPLDFFKVFHKIYVSRLIDSPLLRQRPFFSPYGLVHDTSTRRGTRPRRCRALVRSRGGAP